MFSASPGKGKGVDRTPSSDSKGPPDPTPPKVTYRHLLSAGSLVPSNPLRVIAHCDVDAAYAAFEAKRLGVNPFEQPLAVQQWNGLIAISYAARTYGITRHETIDSALKKCPHLQLVHVATYAAGAKAAAYNPDPSPDTHKVSLDPYRRESAKILSIFKKTCPAGNVEKASIDESYFDLTIEVRKLILEKYPHLSQAPKDSPLGMDTPLPDPPKVDAWEERGLGYLVPIGGEKKKEEENRKDEVTTNDGIMGTEAALAESSSKTEDAKETSEETIESSWNWTDVALAMGAELMARVRKEVEEQLGYTTSAGIAPNKSLAKLCSSYKKPNAQTTMRLAAIPGFLYPLPFQKIRFLGGKLGDAINQEWESSTVGDLWNVSLRDMQARFGDESLWVWNVLRGVDHSEVRERVANKTMLASKNVRPAITKSSEASHWLSILSTELCVRLHEARETAPTLWPKTLVLRYLRSGDAARSRQTPFPFTKNLNSETLLKSALRLWVEAFGEGENLNGGAEGSNNSKIYIVTIALGFSGLERGEVGQKSLEGFFSTNAGVNPSLSSSSSRSKNQNGKAEVDQKRSRSNSPTIEMAQDEGQTSNHQDASSSSKTSTDKEPVKKKKKRADGIEALFRKASATQAMAKEESSSTPSATSTTSPPIQDGQQSSYANRDASSSSSKLNSQTWDCPQCKKTLTASLPDSMGSDQDLEVAISIELQRLVQDHEDWHFAMSIHDEDRNANSTQQTQSSTQSKKKKKKRPLDAFFKATPSQK